MEHLFLDSKIAQAHLDSLYILIFPLIEAKAGKDITSEMAHDIIYRWDQARTPKTAQEKRSVNADLLIDFITTNRRDDKRTK